MMNVLGTFLRKSNSTNTAIDPPIIRLIPISVIEFSIKLALFESGIILSCGISLFILSISFNTPLATATVLTPLCFVTDNLIPGFDLFSQLK